MRTLLITLSLVSLFGPGCLMQNGEDESFADEEGLRLADLFGPGMFEGEVDEGAPFLRDEGGAPPADLPVMVEREVEMVFDSEQPGLWWRYSMDESEWQHVTVVNLPEEVRGVRLLPVHDRSEWEDISFALADGERAWVLGWTAGYHEEIPLERAPALLGGSDEEAWAQAHWLRWMQTCPMSWRTCLLYGPAEDVAAAEDPAFPVGGWDLFPMEPAPAVSDAELGDVQTITTESGIALRFASASVGTEDDPLFVTRISFARTGAWIADVATRWTEIEPEYLPVDVTPVDGRLLVTLWYPESVMLVASFHDAVTEERIGEPTIAQAEPYFEPECGNVISGTRPMAVVDGDTIHVALYWGDTQALLFEEPGADGRFVDVAFQGEPPYEPSDESVPPFFRSGMLSPSRVVH